jgi:hypothetical protein
LADLSPEEQNSLLPFILDKMQTAPSVANHSDLSSSVQDSSLFSREEGGEGMEVMDTAITPVPPPLEGEQGPSGVVGTVCSDGGQEETNEQVHLGE